ncbi:TetR family transcriptional regulator [Novosphingobium sp. FGD1]|uniref:TetR family transcriptional regulator n=1 Tax=Novosphingobium silvae TaxID=2692619 RepID=A0A7X4GJ84_9SPHN|nr:TetR/AcrR family transcriptional regulator [Novosphingobium silvae]MYL99320.1 TetR family transcriptional regulator [Novosphingobium silvae]
MTALTALKEASVSPRALTPRQLARRERIQAATFSMLARHGGEALSMKMIAQTAGVAERTLFNIYGSKDGLFASSARERSEETIAHVHQATLAMAEDCGGMAFFHALPRALADKTFEAPALARAFAPILVAHAGLVGMPEIYETYAGHALQRLQGNGLLSECDIALLSRLVCMSTVSTIILWAKHQIEDDALETQLRLAICQVLLPHAQAPLDAELRDEARRCIATLAQTSIGA